MHHFDISSQCTSFTRVQGNGKGAASERLRDNRPKTLDMVKVRSRMIHSASFTSPEQLVVLMSCTRGSERTEDLSPGCQ